MKAAAWTALALSVAPYAALAQTPPPSPINTITELTSKTGVICRFFNFLFALLIILAVIFGLVAAFRYLTAAGDPEKVKGASSTLLYAAIAVVVALIAKAIPFIATSFVSPGSPLNTAFGC